MPIETADLDTHAKFLSKEKTKFDFYPTALIERTEY